MQRQMRSRARILVAIPVLALLLFLALAAAVGAGTVAELDRAILLWARARSTGLLDVAMLWLTTLGDGRVVVPLVIVFFGWCLAERDPVAAVTLAAVGLACESTTRLLKLGFERARPELWPRIPLPTFAFPSGHAMVSIAVFGMFAAVLVRRRPRLARPVIALTVMLGATVGASRVYLGVHWPSDVLAGWVLGGGLLAIGCLILSRWPAIGRTTGPKDT
jgi:undecaprenyl-diphosphatase